MQSLMKDTTAGEQAAVAAQTRQGEAVAAETDRLKGELQATENALEDARSKLVPGIKSSAALRNSLLYDKLSKTERIELDKQLIQAVANDQLDAKIVRLDAKRTQLQKDIVKSKPERSETFGERSAFGTVQNVRERSERLNALALASAILIEIAIAGGIWSDGLHNKGQAAPVPAPAIVQSPPNAGRTTHAQRFETWLAKEWRTKRDKDGWLRGSQQGWARSAGMSSATVHTQLERLVGEGKIQKHAERKQTWVRFVKQGELKIVT